MKLTLLFREAFEWMLTTTMNPTLKATPATKTKSRNWLINLSNVKQKKQRKELDIESIKKELLSRNYLDRLVENTPQRKMSTRKSRMATN
jgi:DNA-binding LytR/AlgR family response regulator